MKFSYNPLKKIRIRKHYQNIQDSQNQTNIYPIPTLRSASQSNQTNSNNQNIKIDDDPYNQTQHLSKLKTKTDPINETNIVYNIKYEDSGGRYTGQTKQSFHKRNHDRGYNNKMGNRFKREILEIVHIKYDKNSINQKIDNQNVSFIYHNANKTNNKQCKIEIIYAKVNTDTKFKQVNTFRLIPISAFKHYHNHI